MYWSLIVVGGFCPKQDSDPTRSFRCVSLRDEVSGLDLYRSILSTDTLHRLMFSTLMLNRRLQEGHAMTLNQWIELNTGIEGVGNDVPVHVQSCIYKSVVSSGLMTSGRQILPPWISVGVFHLRSRQRCAACLVGFLGARLDLSVFALIGSVWFMLGFLSQ